MMLCRPSMMRCDQSLGTHSYRGAKTRTMLSDAAPQEATFTVRVGHDGTLGVDIMDVRNIIHLL